jgi:outer membrane exchange protein TraA
LTQANAVAPPRLDPGSGICGSVIHYVPQMAPLDMISQAVDLLNLPATDPNIAARVTTTFTNINFRNADPSAAGDFGPPNFTKTLFPFSDDPSAMPPGDDLNFALRIRGYLNVPNTLNGSPVTFGVNCDDACSLAIGTTPNGPVLIIPDADERISARVTQQVIFQDPGLYPVEIVYYQNASQAYLEWSEALSAQPQGNQITPLDTMTYSIISPANLYTAIVGSNPSCQECGAPGQTCSTGQYCGDGLCQVCNTPSHCGSNCMTCPANMSICSNGTCVQCTGDGMCPPGEACVNGMCAPPVPCTSDSMCPTGEICSPTGFCGTPPTPCATNAECPTGEICQGNVCVVPPTHCLSDSDCTMYEYCDTASQTCMAKNAFLYEGGLSCSAVNGASNATSAGGSGLAVLLLLTLGLAGRRKRRVSGFLFQPGWRQAAKANPSA